MVGSTTWKFSGKNTAIEFIEDTHEDHEDHRVPTRPMTHLI
jgi:hypothetical protein